MTRCSTKRKRSAAFCTNGNSNHGKEGRAIVGNISLPPIATTKIASDSPLDEIKFSDWQSARVCSIREDNEPKHCQSSLLSFFAKAKRMKAAQSSPQKRLQKNDNDNSKSNSRGFWCSKENRASLVSSLPTAPSCSSSFRRQRNPSIGKTATEKRSQKSSKPKAKSLTQVYIDCGQSSFGQILCDKCGMLYMPGIAEDELQHKQFCQAYTHGIPCVRGNVKGGKYVPDTGSVNALAAREKGRKRNGAATVVLWRPGTKCHNRARSKQRQQHPEGFAVTTTKDAEISKSNHNKNLPSQWPLLAQMISKDLGTNEETTLNHIANQMVFLYIESDNSKYLSTSQIHRASAPGRSRILGVATVQVLSRRIPAYEMISLHERSLTSVEAKLGIGLLWTHPVARQRGIATRLVDAARGHAIFGMKVTKTEVAYSSPTQAGYDFAIRYSCCRNEKNGIVSSRSDENDDCKGCDGEHVAIHPKEQSEASLCRAVKGPLVYEIDL